MNRNGRFKVMSVDELLALKENYMAIAMEVTLHETASLIRCVVHDINEELQSRELSHAGLHR